MSKPILAITMGDPGGIGPEVVMKALRDPRILKRTDCVVLGPTSVLEHLRKRTKIGNIHLLDAFDQTSARSGKINFLNIEKTANRIMNRLSKSGKSRSLAGFDAGKISLRNAVWAYAALEKASELARAGQVSGLVTAPINKTSMRLMDAKFEGHTEFLAKKTRSRSYAMMFISERLKVTLVTIHTALRKVAHQIQSRKVLEKIVLTDQFLRKRFKMKKPRLAVCALNPHGMETGTEEAAKIAPAVKAARKKRISVEGPFSADRLFYDCYEGKYDALVSMYHDQALAPFKMIAFHDGVNVTLGLPFVRTSPDHGTAFDIAYRGRADARSMKSAILLAQKLIEK